MDAALTIQTAREHAGLSKRELARRARTSPAAIVAYESGSRDPTVGTLDRIVSATGAVGTIELGSGATRPETTIAGRRLAQVLDLAELLPHRAPSPVLAFPPFPPRLMPTLAEQLLAVHEALDAASLPHAFGGAIALAFHVEEPRATRDLDVNVFVEPARAVEVFDALPDGVAWNHDDVARVQLDGQVRLLWDSTPIDLFFSTHAFHEQAWLDLERASFADTTIPILGATELVVFKVFFDRTRDWADVEAMLDAHTPDVHAALGWLVDLLGVDDERVTRLRDLLRRDPRPEPRFDA